jgi:ribosomal protein S18 acetylase RimI-like enzyme
VLSLKTTPNEVDWSALTKLIEVAGLGQREAALVERVFKGSFAVCFAYEDGKLIGAGRAISDGVTSSVIYDVVVSPQCQGRGIGKQIMQDLIARLPRRSVMLLSVPKQRGFYEKLGFQTLKTAMLKHEHQQFWIDNGYIE